MKSTRVNLAIPLELAIKIEKECDKRGLERSKYIKECIYEKFKKNTESEVMLENYDKLSQEISDLKRVMMLVLDKINNK
jgi:hypothetical protein